MNLDQTTLAIGTSLKSADELAKLKKATQGLEAIFAKQLLSEMRKSVQKVSLGQSMGKEIFEDMMDQTIAENASKGGALGLGKQMYDTFSKRVFQSELAHLKLDLQNRASQKANATTPK